MYGYQIVWKLGKFQYMGLINREFPLIILLKNGDHTIKSMGIGSY